MASNPVLEEVWRIKDQLAAEADYDVDKYFDNLRKWCDEHPHPGPVAGSPAELRRLLDQMESEAAAPSPMVLKEKPPGYDK